MSDHEILFLPGPTEVEAELRQVMAMPLVGHRSAGFIEEVKAVCGKLKPLFRTDAHALFENCSATALMEVAMRNLVGERSLHLVCGAFSERWYKVAAACGRKPDAIEVAWGDVITPEMLKEKLQSDGPYEAVMITHSETSTGALAPLQEMAAVVREAAPDTLVLVDAVSALAGAEMHFDAWGLDLVFAGTQKCLALPPGLCVYALSERAMEKAATMPARGWLTDFVRAAEQLGKGKTPATPCVPLVYALSRQLDRIAAETMEGRWARHKEMHGMVHEWAADKGFSFLVREGYRSPTVSAMKNSGREVTDLIAKAKAVGFTLGNGYGKLKGETFRIGHMGDHPPARLARLLAVLE
jgi:aspartate aminotransferase-like enzyme